MRRFFLIAIMMLWASPTMAGQLVCAENEITFQLMCFPKAGVRQNGDVRATKLWQGGPKNVTATNFTARVHCISGALELTDRDGIAFARNIPDAQVGKDFVRFLCEHSPTKQDKSLKTK